MIDALLNRKRAYQQVFAETAGGAERKVLADLKRFSNYPEAPIVRDLSGATDAFATGRMIGRQEVFNRIRAMVLIDDQALFNLKEEAATDE